MNQVNAKHRGFNVKKVLILGSDWDYLQFCLTFSEAYSYEFLCFNFLLVCYLYGH